MAREDNAPVTGRCPVVHNEDGSYRLTGHPEVKAAALDPVTFSSAVSAHRALPNSLDGSEHAAYRALVDRYMTDEKVAEQEPQCQQHARQIIDSFRTDQTVDAVDEIGTPFAVRTQSTWLGWPTDIEDELVQWVADNRAAVRQGDKQQLGVIAQRFDDIITRLLEARRQTLTDDVTTELMNDTVNGDPLPDSEIVSILRNWTAGDLGSLSASVGVIVHQIASDPDLQRELRDLVAAGRTLDFEDAIEEMLRIDDPFVSNRRITTRDVTVSSTDIPAGTRVHLDWTSANQDPVAFPDPTAFDPAHNRDENLVFGIGPHVCPGKALTLMELRVIIWELLAQTSDLTLSTAHPPVREEPPANEWTHVPVVIRR